LPPLFLFTILLPPISTLFPYTTLFRSQTDMINNSLTGGCSPEVTNDFNGQSIDLCEGGALTITWNIVDACETTSTTATYTLTERSEEHTSELQSRENLVCRLLLEKKKY